MTQQNVRGHYSTACPSRFPFFERQDMHQFAITLHMTYSYKRIWLTSALARYHHLISLSILQSSLSSMSA